MIRIIVLIGLWVLPHGSFTKLEAKKSGIQERLSDVPIQESDQQVSEKIIEIYGELKNKKIDSKKIDDAIKEIKKNGPLDIFTSTLKNLRSISKEKKIGKVIDSCRFKDKKLPIIEIFQKRIKKFCRNLILNHLEGEKKLETEILSYLKGNTMLFLEEGSVDRFAHYLKNINNEGRTYLLLSKFVRDAYINHEQEIHPEILSSIHIDSKFTSYIQAHRLVNLGERALFDSEFRNMAKEVQALLKNKKIKEATIKAQILISFHKQNASLIGANVSQTTLLSLGKKFARHGDFFTSHTIHYYNFHQFNGPSRERAAFEILFNFIRQKQYKKAIAQINALDLLKKFDTLGSKLQYWIAYSVDRFGQKDLANILYTKLIESNPLSFYSIVAYKENGKIFKRKNTLVEKSSSPLQARKGELHVEDYFVRLKIWLTLGYRDFIQGELDSIFFYIGKNAKKFHDDSIRRIIFELGVTINKEEQFLYAFQLLYKSLKNNEIILSKDFLRLFFPTPYFDKIKKINKETDPYLILSLIRQESAFDPNAISSAGARGLMQIMPATARQYRKKLKTAWLKRPNLNLEIGIRYLTYLIKKYEGNLIYSLASYNAGERRLKQWVEDIFKNDDPLVLIELIPYRETRNYIKLVYRNLFFYKYLSNEKDFIEKDLHKSFIVAI